VWAVRGPNTLRTIPFRSGQIRNPWRPQWDMSLNKAFHFTEKENFQFRLEAFNVFNTPILGGVDTKPEQHQFRFRPQSGQLPAAGAARVQRQLVKRASGAFPASAHRVL
jgi:hypothetical protein